MSKYLGIGKVKKFVVICRWKDNPENFQVIEYFHEQKDAKAFIKNSKKSELYSLEVAKYE